MEQTQDTSFPPNNNAEQMREREKRKKLSPRHTEANVRTLLPPLCFQRGNSANDAVRQALSAINLPDNEPARQLSAQSRRGPTTRIDIESRKSTNSADWSTVHNNNTRTRFDPFRQNIQNPPPPRPAPPTRWIFQKGGSSRNSSREPRERKSGLHGTRN